jgi:hypothetical protein
LYICKDPDRKLYFYGELCDFAKKDETMAVLVIRWACKWRAASRKRTNQSSNVWWKYQEPRCVVQHGPLFNLIACFCAPNPQISSWFPPPFRRLHCPVCTLVCIVWWAAIWQSWCEFDSWIDRYFLNYTLLILNYVLHWLFKLCLIIYFI